MRKSVPIYEVKVPEYKLGGKLDYRKIGSKIDAIIEKNFRGKYICIRAIGSIDHPNLSMDQLIKVIADIGTDKYDTNRKSFWHDIEFYKDKGIDIFACLEKVADHFEFMHSLIKPFAENAVYDRGYAVRLDLLLIYDPDKLEQIPVVFGPGQIENYAFRFKDPDNKKNALLGIIKIL